MRELGPIEGLRRAAEIERAAGTGEGAAASGFAEALRDAIREVDELQKSSERAQAELASGEPVELHEVLMKVEEADVAFRTMMSVRNKLVDAYREVMRMGSGG